VKTLTPGAGRLDYSLTRATGKTRIVHAITQCVIAKRNNLEGRVNRSKAVVTI